ncbi:3'-5' ssDNA/RNA exonuclease TatD isoform X2 [Daktulosphaira vitifoliae]|uniref:3'-5' ssDNA/RNA exonuclease TatD isoform X2 n=1 Tax=Daktulosphaira vitifoliae TaxID=58002 RepID=UPI0021AAA967|nr:3'-5' ssDNA/RNA exonuclease TatD isoform X2 [Daktulosphaira vitifoliae]
MASQHNENVEVIDPFKENYDNYLLIDAGANMVNKKFSRDLESVLQRAKDSGVQKIIVPCTSLKTSKEALRLARIYPGALYSTAGIHPHEAKSWDDNYYEELKDIASNSECVAIGICGLDYNKDFSTPDTQRKVFEIQLSLALELKKPILLHQKGAHDDFLRILKSYSTTTLPTTILHSFTGTFEEATDYINFGMYIGGLCKDSSGNGIKKLLNAGKLTLDKILVQTDSPFMYPNARAANISEAIKSTLTQRSLGFLQRYCTFHRNEPCSLPIIVELIAGFIGKKPDEVALASSFNALKIFGMS